jgi:tetratricopeptide (TPR) repeat protein
VRAADIRSTEAAGDVAQTTRATVPTTIVSASETTDVEELFILGQTHLRQGRPGLAAETFDRVVLHDAEGPFSERALFQGGLAYDAVGDLDAAALRFEQVARRFPAGAWSAEATLRALRVRLHLEQWARAEELASALTEREPQGPPLALIVSHAARALAALAAEQREDADRHVAKGLSIAERLGLARAGTIPRDLAILYFASGEAYRLRAEAAALAGDVEGFTQRLVRRCELILAAQGAYSNVMRAYDAHWSTVAGYRVGELYERLHRDLTALPMPRTGSEREQRLFEGAMRLRYSVLLGKAESMLEHTLAMAARTGESSEWVARTESARLAIARARRAEQEALARLPFTRDELERAMNELGARSTSGR